MSPLNSRPARLWVRRLVAAALSSALLGCDANPGGPSAPSRPSSASDANADPSAAPQGGAVAKSGKRGLKPAAPPVVGVN
jgi:hypothetical protein